MYKKYTNRRLLHYVDNAEFFEYCELRLCLLDCDMSFYRFSFDINCDNVFKIQVSTSSRKQVSLLLNRLYLGDGLKVIDTLFLEFTMSERINGLWIMKDIIRQERIPSWRNMEKFCYLETSFCNKIELNILRLLFSNEKTIVHSNVNKARNIYSISPITLFINSLYGIYSKIVMSLFYNSKHKKKRTVCTKCQSTSSL